MLRVPHPNIASFAMLGWEIDEARSITGRADFSRAVEYVNRRFSH